MTHNPFEKQIADKLNQYEVQPDDGLLHSIFEKRAARRKPLMGLAGLAIAVSVIAVAISAAYFYNKENVHQPVAAVEVPQLKDGESQVSQAQDAASSQGQDVQVAGRPGVRQQSSVTSSQKARNQSNKRISGGGDGSGRKMSSARGVVSTGTKSPASGKSLKSRFQGDNGENITQRYFDINASNRPNIAESSHKGNSHLYVYQSVSDDVLDAHTRVVMDANPLNKFAARYTLDPAETVQLRKIKHESLSRTPRQPVFIDLLYVPMVSGISASGNPGVENYVNSISKSSFNSQYGVRVSVPVSARVNLFSGLFYQDQVNHYKGNIGRPVAVEKINTNVSYINDPIRGVITVTTHDTVNVMENRETAYDFRNKYTIFQLPLGVSYNFGYKKFDFALNGSALLNLCSYSTGHAMDMENNRTQAFASSGKYLGVGAGISVMSALKISPRFKFILEPGLQYFGINGMKSGNNVNEKIINKQLSVGLRYTVF
jgi:hypothetical protein